MSLTYIDVGAAGHVDPRWKRHLDTKAVAYVGFEPDARSFDDETSRVFPVALGNSKGEKTLFLTAKPQVSSFLKPNPVRLGEFVGMEKFDLVSTVAVSMDKLDNFEISGPKFLKLDVQGFELEALMGAKKTLRETVGLMVEVEFQDIYKGQPLFGDILNFLTSHGFIFEDFIALRRWTRKTKGGPGQLVFGEALFIRDFESNPSMNMLDGLMTVAEVYSREDLMRWLESMGVTPDSRSLRRSRARNKFRAALRLLLERLGIETYLLA